jgi:SAM-dependent methyltransferase
MSGMHPQVIVDAENARFWNELCGSHLARRLGVTGLSKESFRRFDEAFLQLYPYLDKYVSRDSLAGHKVLEIGIGYGTLGQLLAQRSGEYYGLDIAESPVDLMNYRLSLMGPNTPRRVQQGSALAIPHNGATFDDVYSIGCLHHTGDVRRAVAEVHRVLKPGGKAVVMLYNRHSFRQLTRGFAMRLRAAFLGKSKHQTEQQVRAMYDANSKGEAAPCTEYVSRAEARTLFAAFRHVRIDVQNFDTCVLFGGRVVIPRKRLLRNLAHVAGLDLYIVATK